MVQRREDTTSSPSYEAEPAEALNRGEERWKAEGERKDEKKVETKEGR